MKMGMFNMSKLNLFMISLSLLLISCGQNPVEVGYVQTKDGIGCFSDQTATGTLLTCSNGTTFIPNPTNGLNGANALINILPTAPSCANGGITLITGTDENSDGLLTSVDSNLMTATVCNGTNGLNGADGATGATGAQGLPGQNGTNGVTPPFSTVSTIATCGNTVAWKEQLLCLANGKLLGSFSENINGYNTRLAFLADGSYMNTDGSNCNFTVLTLSDGSTRVSWSGGAQVCVKN
jgi:hypothetical protein